MDQETEEGIPRPGLACVKCGNFVACTCPVARKHQKGCRYRRAAALSIELACGHGYQACHICDACDCGAGETEDMR